MPAGSPVTLMRTAPQKHPPVYEAVSVVMMDLLSWNVDLPEYALLSSGVRCYYPRPPAGRVRRNAAVIDQNAMDALSDVLKSVQLEGAVFVNAEFTAPWCIWSRFGLARASKRLAAADHMVFFHFL